MGVARLDEPGDEQTLAQRDRQTIVVYAGVALGRLGCDESTDRRLGLAGENRRIGGQHLGKRLRITARQRRRHTLDRRVGVGCLARLVEAPARGHHHVNLIGVRLHRQRHLHQLAARQCR